MALVKLPIIWCIFFDIMVKLLYWLFAGSVSNSEKSCDKVSLRQNEAFNAYAVFNENSSGTADCSYCVCSSETPSCIHAFVYLTKQMPFAWAWGLVFPSKAYSYGNWEKGKHKIGGKCLWPRELGVSNKPARVWSFLQWNMTILRQKKWGKNVELLEDQRKGNDLMCNLYVACLKHTQHSVFFPEHTHPGIVLLPLTPDHTCLVHTHKHEQQECH